MSHNGNHESSGLAMEPYNFWQDVLDTYQSLSDGMKALWILMPPAFVLGVIALVLSYRLARQRVGASDPIEPSPRSRRYGG